jgi:hypothetical protein
MDLLPHPKDQSALLSFLGKLIEQRGAKTFLSAPILLPNEASFPDHWTPDAPGVSALALRLLQYVGLPQLKVNVKIFEREQDINNFDWKGKPISSAHKGAAAWYAGMPDGVCLFGAEADQLSQPEGIVGAMCHEIAHAWRNYHRLEHWEHDLEERLTDLSTIYLGFGVLTVNASYRYRATSDSDLSSRSSHQQLGYLSPQEMSFLLAVQIVARDLSKTERKVIISFLEPNQRAYVKEAIRHLEKQREQLLQELKLPTQKTSEPRTFAIASKSTKGQFNLFLPVFRVPVDRNMGVLFLGVGLGALVAVMSQWVYSLLWLSALLFVTSSLIGFLLSKRERRYICSDARCNAEILPTATTCSCCGGQISGTLTSQRQHESAMKKALYQASQGKNLH